MKWFKHDTTALHDAKIEKLLMKYGIQGYGLYFACVEIIAGNLTNENITFELEHDAEILAYKFKLDTLLVEEMVKYMCKLGLFKTKNNKIFCYKLASRIDSSLIKNANLVKIKQQIQEESRRVKKVQDKSNQTRIDKIRLEENRINNTMSNIPYKEIIEDLNSTCNSNFRHTTKSTKDKINARYNEGFSLIDFMKVNKIKAEQWIDDTEMNKYLRPETLYGNKFESYLQEYKRKYKDESVSTGGMSEREKKYFEEQKRNNGN